MEIQNGLPLCTPHSLLGMQSLICYFSPKDEKDKGLQMTFCQPLQDLIEVTVPVASSQQSVLSRMIFVTDL